jgi:hypothetical protein
MTTTYIGLVPDIAPPPLPALTNRHSCATALRAQPGQWFLLGAHDSAPGARNITWSIQRGDHGWQHFGPDYQAQTHTMFGQHRIYARYAPATWQEPEQEPEQRAPAVPTARVQLPGSFCDWLAATLAALGPAPALDDVRAALDAAYRTERRHGYFLTLDATAPVLETLSTFAADCVALGRPATGHNVREAARTGRLRLQHAHATLTTD